MRLLAAGAPALAAALVGFALAAPPAGADHERTCASLDGRSVGGPGAIRVTRSTSRSRSGALRRTYRACGGRTGVVRVLRPSRAGGRLEVLGQRGAFLAYRDLATRRVFVQDVVRGPRVRLQSGGRSPVGPILLGRAGEAIGLLPAGPRRRVVGFDVGGRPYPLGTGTVPARSLRRVRGDVVRWTTSGRVVSTDLASPRVPCDELRGRVVKTTPEVRVVSITFPADFLVGELDGVERRLRACARAGGAVRTVGSATNPTGGVQGGADVDVPSIAGVRLLSHERSADSEGNVSSTIARHDLATGAREVLFSSFGTNASLGDVPLAMRIAPSGQAAVLLEDLVDFESAGDRLVGFPVGGSPRELDAAAPTGQIVPASLRFDSTVLSWSRAGEPRSADLASGP